MGQIPNIESVMTAAPLSIDIEATLRQAQDLMIDHEIRHLPVTEEGVLVGVVTDRDIAFSENAAEEGLADRVRVRSVCSLDVYAVAPDASLDEVLAEMAERRIGSAVVSEQGKIAGLFTATDACRCFAEHLRRIGD